MYDWYDEWESPGGVLIRKGRCKRLKKGSPLQIYHIFEEQWYTVREFCTKTGIAKTTVHHWLKTNKPDYEFFKASGSSYEYDPSDIASYAQSRDDCTPEQLKLLNEWDEDYVSNPEKYGV